MGAKRGGTGGGRAVRLRPTAVLRQQAPLSHRRPNGGRCHVPVLQALGARPGGVRGSLKEGGCHQPALPIWRHPSPA